MTACPPDETGADLYPWKRWHVRNDPVGSNSQPPISVLHADVERRQCS
jgi:hypothetical protein